MTEGDHYVANMEYQSLWKTRDEKIKRSATDAAFLIIFALLTVLWIGIGIHGFTNGDGIPTEVTIQVEKWMIRNKIMDALSYSKSACFGFIGFTVLLIALFFIMVRWVTKFTIFATLVVDGLGCLFVSYSFLMTRLFVIFTLSVMAWLILGVTIYALKKVGTKIVCKVLQDACKTMICFPSSLLIVLLELAIQVGVVAFTIGATVYLLFIRISTVRVEDESDEYSYLRRFGIETYRQEVIVNPPTYVRILLPVLIGTSLWITQFVGTFRSMLLHGMFSHWYRASDKKNISSTVGLRCLATTSRYHMGTVAFSSTIFAIIPVIGALFNSANSLAKLLRKRPSSLCALWFALLQSLSNASIMCISYGTSLCQSTKDGLQLVMRNPLKYIAVHAISYWVICYGLVTILLIAAGASYHYFVNQIIVDPNNFEQIQSFIFAPFIVVIISSSILAAMLIAILKNAVEAVTICFFEESNLTTTGLEDADHEV
ncbi:hypothetical protein TSAR_008966 [Trichomalopsis sarcophagae]|uniref:Choline transporter-like protein n=1 Tax=Trichomalopsis sarcophagae TaxID=543379 RepID=A0A232EMH0_9HYME|nr:hypothetical protein TSAR_008966 [Trichomalopsis sarcophagae]